MVTGGGREGDKSGEVEADSGSAEEGEEEGEELENRLNGGCVVAHGEVGACITCLWVIEQKKLEEEV